MSDAGERRPLVPSPAFYTITPAETASHPWLAEAIREVWADPARIPRDAFLCFIVDPDPGEYPPWRLAGFGRVVERSDGGPSPLHVPGRMRAGLAQKSWGQTYYVAWWDGERPFLIETWELRVEQSDQTAVGHLTWRPGYPRPRVRLEGLEGLGRRRREALEAEIWSFLEPQSPRGRKERRRRDPAFLRDLDRAVWRVIVDREGRDVRVGDWLTAMEMKKDTYYRRLREWGLPPERVEEWVRRCVQDYWECGAPAEGWELPVRLSALVSANICD